MRVTQAIVLAAGEGRRLRPVTLATPKPLVPFFGRPLLDWAIDALVQAGVTRIAVNTFHLADQVERHVTRLASLHPHLTLHVSREPTLLGTGGAVRYLRDWLEPAPFYVVNSDAVFAEPLTTLAATAHVPSLLVTRSPRLADQRRLLGVGPADTPRWSTLDERGRDDGYTFCGVMLADAELPRRLPDGPSCILRQGFLPDLDRLDTRLVETRAFFADTGTPEALVAAHIDGMSWVASRPEPLTVRL